MSGVIFSKLFHKEREKKRKKQVTFEITPKEQEIIIPKSIIKREDDVMDEPIIMKDNENEEREMKSYNNNYHYHYPTEFMLIKKIEHLLIIILLIVLIIFIFIMTIMIPIYIIFKGMKNK